MTPAIELSKETYKLLEALAKPFQDKSPEDVIKRLIEAYPGEKSAATGHVETNGMGLMASGAVIPNGLELRFNYRGKVLSAVTRGDRIWIGDRSFQSPSAAAVAAAEQLGFPGRSLNGWMYWEYNEDGQWKGLGRLRGHEKVKHRQRRRRR